MILSHPRASLAALLAAALLTAGVADAKLRKAGSTEVTFDGKGPAGFKITGKSTEVGVAEDAGKVTFSVPLRSIDTGMSLRNKHMLEDLEASAPGNEAAVFVVERSALKFPEAGPVTGKVVGQMTLHKQTKPIEITYSARKDGANVSVTGSFPLNINDYGIKVRSYAGITVKPDLNISFNVSLAD